MGFGVLRVWGSKVGRFKASSLRFISGVGIARARLIPEDLGTAELLGTSSREGPADLIHQLLLISQTSSGFSESLNPKRTSEPLQLQTQNPAKPNIKPPPKKRQCVHAHSPPPPKKGVQTVLELLAAKRVSVQPEDRHLPKKGSVRFRV